MVEDAYRLTVWRVKIICQIILQWLTRVLGNEVRPYLPHPKSSSIGLTPTVQFSVKYTAMVLPAMLWFPLNVMQITFKHFTVCLRSALSVICKVTTSKWATASKDTRTRTVRIPLPHTARKQTILYADSDKFSDDLQDNLHFCSTRQNDRLTSIHKLKLQARNSVKISGGAVSCNNQTGWLSWEQSHCVHRVAPCYQVNHCVWL